MEQIFSDALKSGIFDNSDTHIFEFSRSPYKAQIYDNSQCFSVENEKIGIIDQFQGKRPIVLNHEFLYEKKTLDFTLVHTLLLDSHIVDDLHRYVSGLGKINKNRMKVIEQFYYSFLELKV